MTWIEWVIVGATWALIPLVIWQKRRMDRAARAAEAAERDAIAKWVKSGMSR